MRLPAEKHGRTVAAGPEAGQLSQDGLDRSPGRVSRRGARHPVRHWLDEPPERCR